MFRLFVIALLSVGFLNPACCCVFGAWSTEKAEAETAAGGCCAPASQQAPAEEKPKVPCGGGCETQWCDTGDVLPASKLALNGTHAPVLATADIHTVDPGACAADFKRLNPRAAAPDGLSESLWLRHCSYLL